MGDVRPRRSIRRTLRNGGVVCGLAFSLSVACGGKSDGSKPIEALCSVEATIAPACQCLNGSSECPLDCHGAAGCMMTCEEFDTSCSARCGDKCSYRCAKGPSCAAECGADCIVSCEATNTCTGTCGALCNYTCDGAKDCSPTVGDGSQVRCTSVANCNVACTGRCLVRCDRSTNCTTTCPEGLEKKSCDEGWACGIDC